MKKMLAILFVLFAFVAIKAQKDTCCKLIAEIKGDVVDFTVDNLDNVYVLNSKDQLKKYNSNGDSVAVFNNVKRFGKLSSIDASNPLKVLLYYKDFVTIVVLDRLLAQSSVIDLRKQRIYEVNVIAQSYDNNIWLFDESESKLKKIDDYGKLLMQTADFRQLFEEAPQVVNISDQNGFVYLYDPRQNVFVFDYYGGLRNKIPLQSWENFKVAEKFIYGNNHDTLHRYNISTFVQDNQPIYALKDAAKTNFTASRLYALKTDGLKIYSLH
jgi:hypothetical protein